VLHNLTSEQKTYPSINFQICNAENLAAIFQQQFDLIYFFNVLYAIPNRELVLENLYKIAKENSNLVVFDYINLSEDKCYNDGNNELNVEYFINPAHSRLINLKNFIALAEKTGWKVTEIKNIDQEYIRWYMELLEKIETNRSKILELFGQEALETVEKVYRNIYNSLVEKKVGGAIIYAKKMNIKK